MKSLYTAVGLVGLVPAVALGHGGHGVMDGGSLLHYLVEPVHGLAALALVALALAAWKRRAPAHQRRR